jgi:glycosyltransferase involved in cell wall biosynthesis
LIDALGYSCLAISGFALAIVVWNVIAWPEVSTAAANEPGAISVLIPARNEAENIAACMDAALAAGVCIGEVLVYDDRSEDGTDRLVRAHAVRDTRVRLIEGADLPQGWCGKNFACASLADAARGSWLLFLDADARLIPGAADRLLAEAAARHATMISAWPSLLMGSFWERALMPMLNVVTFSLFPAPLSLARDEPSLGLVHGACILVSREAYVIVGGHTAVKGEIFEDQRLAHLWRERGERGFCLDGRTAVSVRMYRSLGEIWRGFQKNFYPAFEREWSFWAYLLLHASTFILPLVLVVLAPSWITVAAVAAVAAIRILIAVRFRHPLWTVLMHPVAEMVLLGIGLASWWRCRSGRGVEWKGRRYLDRGRERMRLT